MTELIEADDFRCAHLDTDAIIVIWVGGDYATDVGVDRLWAEVRAEVSDAAATGGLTPDHPSLHSCQLVDGILYYVAAADCG